VKFVNNVVISLLKVLMLHLKLFVVDLQSTKTEVKFLSSDFDGSQFFLKQ